MCALEPREHSGSSVLVVLCLIYLLSTSVCMCGGIYRPVQPSRSLLIICKYFGLLVMDVRSAILLLQAAYLRRIAQDVLKNTQFFYCVT